jgi:hypothetical protein
MFDLEGIQTGGDLVPWCAGLVLMDHWKLEDAKMFYFAESIVTAHEQGKTVGKNILSYNDFRLLVEGYSKQGYIMYVKGIGFEYRVMYDLFDSKITPALGRIGNNVYCPSKSHSPWRFVLHDLQCAQFNDLYLYYKDHIRITMDHQFLEDYDHMKHKSGGHVPAIECLYFLHHWRLTMCNLLVLNRYTSWVPVYLQVRASKEIVVRQMDLSLYLKYWNKAMRTLSPPLELYSVCYKGPGYDYAFTKLNARLGHFLFHGMETNEWMGLDPEMEVISEEFKSNYGEYFLSQTPFKVLMKKKGMKTLEALEHLKPYGWTQSDINNQYPELVEPNWWGSK